MQIGSKIFSHNKTYIVGILNVTPDSFSDGGNFYNDKNALEHVDKMINDGADIIDVGGESTRPNYKMITINEEIERVVPIIRKIKSRYQIPISIDTYKSEVARAALDAGADCVNDIWGLKRDKNMAPLIKKYNVPVCIMHNREQNPSDINENDFIIRTQNEISESINIAKQNNISDDKIIIDPGVGFGKTYLQNLYCIRHLNAWKIFGYPILLGVSRKSVIGLTLNLPVNQREEGTIAISAIATINGCNFLRVHDVEKNYRAILMAQTIKGEINGSD